MPTEVPVIKLNTGFKMPILGLGTWKSKPGEVTRAVNTAIEVGYRHIDCAYVYDNEKEVGAAFKEKFDNGAVKREDLFVVSKLWNTRHTPEDVLPACKNTLACLGLEYLDLYLVHWPIVFKRGEENFPVNESGNPIWGDVPLLDTWKAMETLVDQGLVRTIGISNFNSEQMQLVLDNCRIKPAVNQVELHPYLSQDKLVSFCNEQGIAVTAYSPFGSPDRPWASPDDPKLLDNPTLQTVAEKYAKSPAQVVLRWMIQRNIITIPKSVTPSRIQQNFEVFDFALTDEDMQLVNSLNRNERFIAPDSLKGSPNYPFHIEF